MLGQMKRGIEMELVIKIDEELYNYMQTEEYDEHLDKRFDSQIRFAVKEGTPLPKHHGALKDENYFLSILRCEDYETCTWRNCSECNREKCIKKQHVVGAPTIVKGEESEEV